MATLVRDLKRAARTLAKSPGFAAIAVLAFALGIGANTAIFSAVNAVLLRPLGYADAERLVMIEHAGPSPVAPATFVDWKAQARSFSGMIAAVAWGGSLRGTGRPEALIGMRVSGETFAFLGVPAMLGRTFTAEEDAVGGPPVVVIAHSLWQRSFGGAADIVGRKIEIDAAPYTVVGVMPEGFQFAPVWVTRAEVWRPLQVAGVAADRDGQRLRVFARLKPGVEVARARAEMTAIMERLARQYPDTSARKGVSVEPLRDRVVGSVQTMLLVLLGTVGFVLLIACANVANLMLARAAGQRREMAVRRALGATRWQLARQSMTEGAVLAVCGGALGVGLAYAGVAALRAVLPPGAMPRQQELGVEWLALAFTAGLSVLTGLVAGVFPALQFAGADVNEGLKEGGRGGSEGRSGNRMRGALVTVETSLAFVLLMGAGLMLRSVGELLTLDPGFDAKGLLSMEVSVAGTRQAAPALRANYYREVMERIRATPGVAAVSAINHAPLTGDVWGTRFRIVGRPDPRPGEWPAVVYRVAWPGYFDVMRTPMVRGRGFSDRDTMESPKVVMVNEAAARRYWAGEEAVGQRVWASGETWTVVGVVRNLKQGNWLDAPQAEMYFPVLQSAEYLARDARHYQALSFVVRAAGDAGAIAGGDAGALAGSVRQAIESVDANVLVSGVTTMEDAVDRQLWRQRLSLLLLGAFGVVALALAVTGIYGVIAQAVSQRTHEIGIRMALGAARGDVAWLAVRQGLAPVVVGIAAGAVLALALTRWMEAMLYGVRPGDPATFVGVAGVMCVAGIFAAFWPARRAARVDPGVALRGNV